MERQKIEQYAKQVLTFCGVERQDVSRQVYDCLCHLLVAMKHLDLMNEEDRAFMMDFVELRMNFYLNAKLVIKEKNKERKRKKKNNSLPPHPLPVEKENKEKEEKTLSLVRDAKEAFRLECKALSEQYDRQEVTKFYEWYTQKDDDGVMLFELERRRKGWNTKTRLKKWLNNQFAASNKAAAIRLKKAQGTAQADSAQQRAIAAERERANAEAERQREADKAGAVSYEEWQASKKTTD